MGRQERPAVKPVAENVTVADTGKCSGVIAETYVKSKNNKK